VNGTPRAVIGAGALAGGLVLFAWCSHQRGGWGVVSGLGLFIAGAALAYSRHGADGALTTLGLRQPSLAALAWTAFGVALGTAAGFAQRHAIGLPLGSTSGVEVFVIVACLIGATEELVYRGWLLGRLRPLGWPVAVVLTALAHTAYKTALFVWPSAAVSIDYVTLISMTAAGGLLLGGLRAASGSLWPAIAAHVAFDYVVYLGLSNAPWWVWG
jgi:membrane protease YdiL (CAAX protease family)